MQRIKQALIIWARTDVELKSEDAEIDIHFSPIETLGFKGKNDGKQTFVRESGDRNKLIDVKFGIQPHHFFVSEI